MSAHPWLDHSYSEWTTRSLCDAMADLQIRLRRWRLLMIAVCLGGLGVALLIPQPVIGVVPWAALAALVLISVHEHSESASLRMLWHLKRWERERGTPGA